jgi:hypothetical protein
VHGGPKNGFIYAIEMKALAMKDRGSDAVKAAGTKEELTYA